jgi:hypothetical protein
VVDSRCCEVCDGCEGEVVATRGVFVHPGCAPSHWRVS